MDGSVKKESEAFPNGSVRTAGSSAAGREEQLVRLYMDLTGCSESEARSTYMHVHRTLNPKVDDEG
jgi:hypothetical protein